MDSVSEKIRKEDLPSLKSVVEILRQHNLMAGLHGTSLWNGKYKDVDLLVISDSADGSKEFFRAVDEIKNGNNAKILEQKGNDTIGHDLDIEVGKMILHLSYVVLL